MGSEHLFFNFAPHLSSRHTFLKTVAIRKYAYVGKCNFLERSLSVENVAANAFYSSFDSCSRFFFIIINVNQIKF